MRRTRLLISTLAAVAAVAAACSGAGSSEGDRAKPEEGEVFLDPFDVVGPNPFTKSVALAPVPRVQPSDARGGARQGLRSVSGTTAGVYGGSGSQQLCDPTAGVSQLMEDEANAQAWVDALNDDATLEWSGGSKLAVEDIATFVGELTSLFVLSDTRVTSHGVGDGRAFAFQSVLQRGTAVMVDVRGVPRARCASFSPLAPPQPAASPKYRGKEWAGFDRTNLVSITAGAPTETFRVVDVHTKELIEIYVGQGCLCDRTKQSSTTTSTVLEEETTTTTARPARTTTTGQRPATTTSRPTTTTLPITTTTLEVTTTTTPP